MAAVHNVQLPGRAFLSRVAALHGITAAQHSQAAAGAGAAAEPQLRQQQLRSRMVPTGGVARAASAGRPCACACTHGSAHGHSSCGRSHLHAAQAAAAALGERALAARRRARHAAIPEPQRRGISTSAGTGASAQALPAQRSSSSGWDSWHGGDWRAIRPADMTPEQRKQLLLEKLSDEWGTDLPLIEPGTHRYVCPACGNGAHGDDAFAVTLTDDWVKWCCHRASCGYQGSVYVYGGRHADTQSVAAAAGVVADAARSSELGAAFRPGTREQHVLQQLQAEQQQQAAAAAMQPPLGTQLRPLTPELLAWFEMRKISAATLERNGVACEERYCRPLGRNELHIAFPYRRGGSIVNIKYRTLDKHFSQTKGGEQIFYGVDEAQGADEIIIVEGEMDKLAVEEALSWQQQQQKQQGGGEGGATAPPPVRRAVLSVPSGAPAQQAPPGSGPTPSLERKFRYVHTASDVLGAASRVVLAVDSDGPGLVLADELARRIGREKCWRVTWPTGPADSLAPGAPAAAAAAATAAAAGDASAALPAERSAASSNGSDAASVEWGRKDANEVLVRDGPAVLAAYLDAAQPLPIRGLFRFDDFWPQVYDLYQQGPRGLSWGVSSGWDAVDECYQVVPGELTVVTGLPNSGKSEWIDALTVNLARHHGWRIGLCSLENSAKEHGRKLMEKYTGKAFFSAAYSAGTSRMSFAELLDALVWIDAHFHLIRPPPDTLPTIDYILDRARAAVMRYGITGLVIDPYNELDHRRPSTFSETEHVSRLLTKVKRFAQHYDVHVWFVAHPRTQRGTGVGGGTASLPAPSMYDISGSAHFINKADNGLVLHRPHASAAEGRDPFAVQLLVRKVRNKLAGKIGDVELRYQRATGTYASYGGGGGAS